MTSGCTSPARFIRRCRFTRISRRPAFTFMRRIFPSPTKPATSHRIPGAQRIRRPAIHHLVRGGGGRRGRGARQICRAKPPIWSAARRTPSPPPAGLTDAHSGAMNDPYLYDVYTILTVNGKVVDVCKTRTGFRKTEFKGGAGTGGVWLNDRLSISPATRNGRRMIGRGWARPIRIGCTTSTRSWCAARTPITSAGCTFRPSAWMFRACDRAGLIEVCPAGDKEKDAQGRNGTSGWKSCATR